MGSEVFCVLALLLQGVRCAGGGDGGGGGGCNHRAEVFIP